MKNKVVAMTMHNGTVTVGGEVVKIKLPHGCIGVLFVFESKAAAKKYWGKKVKTVMVKGEPCDTSKP